MQYEETTMNYYRKRYYTKSVANLLPYLRDGGTLRVARGSFGVRVYYRGEKRIRNNVVDNLFSLGIIEEFILDGKRYIKHKYIKHKNNN